MRHSSKNISNVEKGNVGKIIQEILDNLRTRTEKSSSGIKTGFLELDTMLSGLRDENLIVIAGHPGVGITAFALSIFEHLSIRNSIPVLYFSMETSKERLLERMLLSHSYVDLHKARQGNFRKNDWDKISESAALIAEKPIYIDDTPRLTPAELRHITTKLGMQEDIRCVVVDNLQAMRSGKGPVEEEDRIAEVSRSLKYLALELKATLILLVRLELNPVLSDKCIEGPKISDFGEAIIVERYADVAMMINRRDYYGLGREDYKPSKYSEIIVTKNQNGATGLIGLEFYKEFARFEDIAK